MVQCFYQGSNHAYFGLYNQKMGWSKEQMNHSSGGAPHPPRSISVANNNSVMSYGSGIIHGHIVIDGCLEPVQIKNVHHMPDILHRLISPLQLEDNGLDLQWCCGYGIEFYQGTRLHLYTIQRGCHIILPIYLNLIHPVAVVQMPPAGAPAAMLAVDLDLIHRCLGHACEAMCHTHVEQSEVYSDAQKARFHSSHLSQLCHICALGKQVASPHQKAPTPP